ncbi:hypothetical protein EON64_20815 [archaeon]|nr:MAG: hypothetical protein EON64_20815 [archaeon]
MTFASFGVGRSVLEGSIPSFPGCACPPKALPFRAFGLRGHEEKPTPIFGLKIFEKAPRRSSEIIEHLLI